MSIMKVRSDFFEISVEGDTPQELWEQAAFWHSLPTVCPVDGSAVRFGYAKRGGFDFYFLESTGEKRYEFSIGQGMEDKGLFPGEYDKKQKKTFLRWTYYDRDKQEQVIVWENGRLLVQAPANVGGDGKQAHQVERVVVADGNALVALVDEALADDGFSQDGPEMFDEPSDLAIKRLGLITAPQMRTLHALGGVAGKLKWDEKRPGLCKWASDNRTDSSSQLTQAEAKKLTEFLEVALRKRFDALAQEYLEAGIAMPNVDPDALYGVELASAYKACKKLGERVTA